MRVKRVMSYVTFILQNYIISRFPNDMFGWVILTDILCKLAVSYCEAKISLKKANFLSRKDTVIRMVLNWAFIQMEMGISTFGKIVQKSHFVC